MNDNYEQDLRKNPALSVHKSWWSFNNVCYPIPTNSSLDRSASPAIINLCRVPIHPAGEGTLVSARV